ncbi:MAG TPA: MXAN_5808 family serine peptidase [Anaeromyxobacteraceae bacterium]|jgi:carboxyl-terminal processing protease|nr:MXAN_5808 family serine peptidase [Anaeromyxobacteraceae bacterium]
MIRPLRLVASLAATLALAFGVTYRFVSWEAKAHADELGFRPEAATAPAAGRSEADEPPYPLSKLPVFSRVLIAVKENYVDPKRIDPKAMVVQALDQVEKTVAEVMVEGDAASGRLDVTVGSARKSFDISGVDSVWKTRVVMGDVMAFVEKNLVAHKDLREIEYAATNGMLSTLDPHSMLLDPKMFKEMKLQTKGEFGGLGFVIGMKDGNLTVMKVLKGTPAQKGGVKPKDVITRIEEQSTINMDLSDAVDRLRGKPGTRVTITTQRPAAPEPKKLVLTREIINYETVPQARLLDRGIGYVKVSQFSANTTRDLQAAIAQQKAQVGGNLKGLVLDLRGNPGGLLDQAIRVSDLFLSEGVIVKQVGGGDRGRVNQTHEATADPDDLTALPLVVIVNNSSASASEIVAGALKNNNRALVIGRQTFGKGSVQVLYPDLQDPIRPDDELALKLTIAQYLTPGDVSIQEVGVTPDVLLLPGRALKDAVNYFAPPRMMGEVDLDRHISNLADAQLSEAEREKRAAERKARTEKAALELRYLLDEKEDLVAKAMKKEERESRAAAAHADLDLTPEQQEDDEAEQNPDQLVEDYQIRFAKDLLARAPFADRPRLLDAARGFVAERRNEEDRRLQAKLEQLGVDWSSGPQQGSPRALVTVTPAPGVRQEAGESVPWTVTVENKGDGPLRRLRAWTLVDKNPLLDRREFVFGQVKPGEKRSWTVPVKLPKGMDSRRDDVTLHFQEEGGRAPADLVTQLDVVEGPKPLFALSTQVVDDAAGNGDGLVERGEELELRVDVRNEGSGPSGDKTYVILKALGDDKTFIKKGRAVIGAVPPGEARPATFQLEVKKGLKANEVPLRVTVVDEKLDEIVSEKVLLPMAAQAPSRAAFHGVLPVNKDALLRAGASADAAPLALAPRGSAFSATAAIGCPAGAAPGKGKPVEGCFYKVEWQKGRSAFVSAADVAAVQRGKPSGEAKELWQREPPRIVLGADSTKGAPAADGDHWRLTGSASVPPPAPGVKGTRLRDVFVFVNERKIFFKVAPEGGAQTKVDFAVDVPLKPGNNVVTVFAREDEDFQSRRSVVVHRRGGAEVAQGRQQ